MKITLALALLCIATSASAATTTNWLRCAFAGTRCLPTVSELPAQKQASTTSTKPKPKPTTTQPWIVNK